jgi:hypothetical protein
LSVKEEVIGYRNNYSLMKAPSISRRIWIVVSTVAVIGGFFADYFFVYMEARREELEAKKFRTLAQYADNIRESYAERTKKIKKRLWPHITLSRSTWSILRNGNTLAALS